MKLCVAERKSHVWAFTNIWAIMAQFITQYLQHHTWRSLKNRLVHFGGLIARWSIDEHTFVRAPKEFGQYEGLKGTGYEYTFRYNELSDPITKNETSVCFATFSKCNWDLSETVANNNRSTSLLWAPLFVKLWHVLNESFQWTLLPTKK